jgi:hypothetical protein
MSKRVWHTGPPPHVGWWNADWVWQQKDVGAFVWRWWDGNGWGGACFEDDSAEAVVNYSALCFRNPKDIVWTTYWPKNARVPRIDPR